MAPQGGRWKSHRRLHASAESNNERGALLTNNRRRYLKRVQQKRCKNRADLLTVERSFTKEVLAEQTKTMRLDDAQLSEFEDELTQRIVWATNRIVDEVKPKYIMGQEPNTDGGTVSWLLKYTIGMPIILFGIAILAVLYQSAGLYWSQGWSMRLAVMFLGITAFDCLFLGVEILREKDRNYVVALFSALVSLVALIVALVK